jgi:hypothetical protein
MIIEVVNVRGFHKLGETQGYLTDKRLWRQEACGTDKHPPEAEKVCPWHLAIGKRKGGTDKLSLSVVA